jgi:hypothetical protein
MEELGAPARRQLAVMAMVWVARGRRYLSALRLASSTAQCTIEQDGGNWMAQRVTSEIKQSRRRTLQLMRHD